MGQGLLFDLHRYNTQFIINKEPSKKGMRYERVRRVHREALG